MKYTVSCDRRDPANAASKKYGFFESEHDIVDWIREKTGLAEGQRHPLTWIMEAADDIAYSILDIEDAMKKGIISPDDISAIIQGGLSEDHDELKNSIRADFNKIKGENRSIGEIREIKSSYMRTNLIRNLISYAVDKYEKNWKEILLLNYTTPLLGSCELCDLLKETAYKYVFSSIPVRRIEAEGSIAIRGLMSFFWKAIADRESESNLQSKRRSAPAAYGWSLISDNYRQVASRIKYTDRAHSELPMRYRELRLLTDMMAGMTDGFSKSLFQELRASGHIDGN